MIMLKDVAECLNGYTFREKPTIDTDIPIIQIGDVLLDGTFNIATAIRTAYEPIYNKFIVQKGDIIFRGRAGYAAAIVNDDIPMIVASPLIIVRPASKKAYSEYIAWSIRITLFLSSRTGFNAKINWDSGVGEFESAFTASS